MKKICLSILFSLIFLLTNAQPVFQWANQIGSWHNDFGRGIALDNLDNVYLTGTFRGIADFDPGPGTLNLGFDSLDYMSFISKFDARGDLIWAKQIGDTGWGSASCNDIVLDRDANIFVIGNFGGTVDFDPGPNTYTITASSCSDLFICKLDSAGNFIWVQIIPGPVSNQNAAVSCQAITLDKFGNIYATGRFHTTVDFDPGPSAYYLTSSCGWDNTFILKLDSAGNFIWVKSIEVCRYMWPFDIIVDNDGNIYSTGAFCGTIDFDPGQGICNLTAASGPYSDQYDVYVLKLNSAGNFIWAKRMGGPISDWGFSLALNSQNNLFVTGEFQTTTDFDPGPAVYNLTTNSQNSFFIACLDSAGSFIWANGFGGGLAMSMSSATAIITDRLDNLYVTGYLSGTLDFDPGPGIYNVSSQNNFSAFVAEYDKNGNFICAGSMGVNNNILGGLAIAVDKESNAYTTGEFSNQWPADFDPGLGTYYMYGHGNEDIYISKVKMGPCNSALSTNENEIANEDFTLFPNPTHSTFTVHCSSLMVNSELKIYNSMGALVHHQIIKTANEKIDLKAEGKGIYFLKLSNGEVKKVVLN